jgi:MFS family permease
MTHGRAAEAEAIVKGIEDSFRTRGYVLEHADFPRCRLQARSHTPLAEVFDTLFNRHRTRAFVGLALMASQAFFYNAIFFTYALVLTDFYAIPADHIGWFMLPFAVGNFLGPLLIGRLFDTIGRRPMIAFTYAISGILLAVSGWFFQQDLLTARGLTIAWMVVFFFASAAASSAYLTVSETFPLEIRALAIAVFYAIGTGIGGVAGPALFGALVESGNRMSVFGGYLFGSALMIAAAVIAWKWGVAAERKPLEAVARPLAFRD